MGPQSADVPVSVSVNHDYYWITCDILMGSPSNFHTHVLRVGKNLQIKQSLYAREFQEWNANKMIVGSTNVSIITGW